MTVFVRELDREMHVAGVESAIITNFAELPSADLPDVVHIHGLWSPMLHSAVTWARRRGIPYAMSPHGMLQKWALKNRWWKKAAGLILYQWADLHRAALLHATAESEVEDIRRLRLRNRVVVAPLGVRLPELVPNGRGGTRKTLLFVSRLQRKKGLPNLIRAWAQLPNKADWRVRIVGPDQENHLAELRTLCSELDVVADFDFVGPKYGAELDEEYRRADLFVLPTYSENFGSVVIEALAHSVPVICTKGAPWQELETVRCGWWIETGVGPLVSALKDAFSRSAVELVEMGARGRQLVEDKYTWESACREMLNGYREVCHGYESLRNEMVRSDKRR